MTDAIHIGLGVLLFSLVSGIILSERRAAQWKRRSEGRGEIIRVLTSDARRGKWAGRRIEIASHSTVSDLLGETVEGET